MSIDFHSLEYFHNCQNLKPKAKRGWHLFLGSRLSEAEIDLAIDTAISTLHPDYFLAPLDLVEISKCVDFAWEFNSQWSKALDLLEGKEASELSPAGTYAVLRLYDRIDFQNLDRERWAKHFGREYYHRQVESLVAEALSRVDQLSPICLTFVLKLSRIPWQPSSLQSVKQYFKPSQTRGMKTADNPVRVTITPDNNQIKRRKPVTLRVAVVGSGPAGSSAAETLVKAGIETYLFERKLDNAKPCGGAIPLCMVSEFDLPPEIIDRRVRKMKMISPSNREVDINLINEDEYIGMCRREVLDGFMRDRAAALGAKLINGTVHKLELPTQSNKPYTLHYNDHSEGTEGVGAPKTLKVDLVIGADGANSRVAKAIDAGDYNYAIAFQERIRIPADKMAYYEDRAEMYVGNDVSPDFYAWVFPKYDHVAVGTGTMKVNQAMIKQLQAGIRARAAHRIEGGQIIKVEAHPIPEHPRPRRVVGRVALVGDAAGTVTKSSGEGIYFAAKSGRMCAETIVEASNGGVQIPTEDDLKRYIKRWDKQYGMTYLVLDILQRVFYRTDATREAFVEMCSDLDVQKMTFDSYLYKTVVPMNPLVQMKVTAKTLASLLRGNALAP